jgi:ABC-2 type transport system permease protein
MLPNLRFQSLRKNKNIRYGGYAALLTLIVVVGLVLVNLLAGQIPLEIDMTENNLFSLSEQTEDILNGLEQPITVYALFETGEENQRIVEVLRRYERKSPLVQLEYVDPELNPGFTGKYDPEKKGIAVGSLIVESGDFFKIIPERDLYSISYNQQGQQQFWGYQIEQQVTGAIIFVSSGYTPTIYQLTGHGEIPLEQIEMIEYEELFDKENYELKPLNLLTEDRVPEDTDVIFINSPKFDITEEEVNKILDFLDAGGKGMFCFDWVENELDGFDTLLASLGVKMERGFVMETNKNRLAAGDNPIFLSPFLSEHDINAPLTEENMNVFTPLARGIFEIERKKRNLEIEPLLTSSDKSWLRTDMKSDSRFKIESDIDGPIDIGVTAFQRQVEMDEKNLMRTVIVGNGQFLGPIYPYGVIKGNIDFLFNSLAWLNNREDSISIRSKFTFKMPLQINGLMQLVYSGVVIILIPLIFLITGLVVWLRRRHL